MKINASISANIVDLNTGEEVWGKPLKYKRADYVTSTFDESNNRYLISAKDVVYAVDASSGNVSELAEYDFEEKESPTNMEIRDGGILLTSDQNMSMLNFDGSQKFHEYFKSPSKSGVFKVIAGAIAVASTAMAASHAYQAGANRNQLGDYNRLGRDHDRASKMFSAIGGAAFEAMAQRFKATAATENAQFILTKLDSGVGLVRVNKDSGEVDKEILLNDKKPEYQVDEFAGYLFYKASDDTVYSYNLKQ